MRILGKSGIQVTPLAVGCWSFGGGEYWGAQDQRDVDAVVARALELGLNLFDTAEMYNAGESERALGRALGKRRHEAVLCSKVGPDHAYADTLIRACEESLRRLGTDYLDLYLLHWPITDRAIAHFRGETGEARLPPTAAEAFGAMEALQRAGKIRSIGVSNFGLVQMREALATGVRIDVNQMPYNIYSRAIEAEILPFCAEQGIALVCSMALQQGLLAGTYNRPEEVPPPQAHSRHFRQERGAAFSRHGEAGAEEEIFGSIPALRELAREAGLTLAQLAIAWTLHRPGVAATLVGNRTTRQLEENCVALRARLSPSLIASIDALSQPVLDKLGDNPDYYESAFNRRIF